MFLCPFWFQLALSILLLFCDPGFFGVVHQAAYIIMSHVAIAAHMMVVKEYGGVTAVLVGSTRKAMSIALSFLFFPKVGLQWVRFARYPLHSAA